MVSGSGRYVIVFNGEIYNHLEVRRALEQRANRAWRGHADTETLLAAIDEFGVVDAIGRCVGMFAFALWDRSERTLYLARDRIGEKPLYWGKIAGCIAFGSELKALLQVPGPGPHVDRDALAQYLRHNYVPAPASIFKGIGKVVPGTLLRISADGRSIQEINYWSALEMAKRGLAKPFKGSQEDAQHEVERVLRRAVCEQMIADVPVGAFLSGGIDSSMIVALMQQSSSRPIKTFTIGFDEDEFNEAHYARSVAAHLGTDHTELYVGPAEARAVIPRLNQVYDEPFADSSQIPTLLVSELARRHVTVSLSGDAGDELFGGYNRYVWTKALWQRMRWVPVGVRKGLGNFIFRLSPDQWSRFGRVLGGVMPRSLRHAQFGDKVHKLARVLHLEDWRALYLRFLSHWEFPEEFVLGASRNTPSLIDRSRLTGAGIEDEMMYCDLVNYLPDDILVKVDRAAMSVSLESRVPFLDHRIIELAWSIPKEFKIREGKGKWILRQALYNHVPHSLIDRPKTGFGIPLGTWLRGPLREWAGDLLNEDRIRRDAYFKPEPITHAWQEHLSGARDWGYLLWDVLMFQAWLAAR